MAINNIILFISNIFHFIKHYSNTLKLGLTERNLSHLESDYITQLLKNNKDSKEQIESLINRGLDISKITMENASEFISDYASDIEIIKFLITQGLDLSKLNFQATSKLYTMSNMANQETLEWFINNGLNLNNMDPYTFFLKFLTQDTFNPEKLKKLMDKNNCLDINKLINQLDKQWSDDFSQEILTWLINNGLDLSKITHSKRIADMVVTQFNSSGLEKLKFLISNGLNLSKINPLDLSKLIKDKNQEKITFLIKNGIDRNTISAAEIINILKENNLKQFTNFIINNNINFQDFNLDQAKAILETAFASGSLKKVEYIKSALSHTIQNLVIIGVNNIDGEWSGSFLDAAINLSNGEILFVPLVSSMITNKYLALFDGLINPGANDSFPYPDEFNISYLQDQDKVVETLPMEYDYQTVIEHALVNNKPYIGVCNGAQHLILKQNGYLKHLNKEEKYSFNIKMEPGSIMYFLSMNQKAHSVGLEKHIYPDTITFPINVQHSYAGVNEKLGNNIELGGVSAYGVPEAVALNFYQVGFQFHPENLYTKEQHNYNLLTNTLKIFKNSKNMNMECIHKYLSSQFSKSFELAMCSSTVDTTPNVDFPRDIIGESFETCKIL